MQENKKTRYLALTGVFAAMITLMKTKTDFAILVVMNSLANAFMRIKTTIMNVIIVLADMMTVTSTHTMIICHF